MTTDDWNIVCFLSLLYVIHVYLFPLGLDPAEPAYEYLHEMIRLDQGDAAYVDVIHTNGAPFIPNGRQRIKKLRL